MSIRSRVKAFPLSDYRADENGAYRTPQNAQRNIFAAPLPVPPLASQDGTPPPLLIPARPALLDCSPAMPCGSRCPHISQTMSSDVILDTVPCLPSRPSSRPRPVLISYRIPDDIATQSITCDTGYDDIRFARPSPRPISSPYLLPAPLPAAPCRPTGRLETRRHPVRYSPRLPALSAYHHLTAPSHRFIHFIRLAPSHRFISRPAERPASSRPA